MTLWKLLVKSLNLSNLIDRVHQTVGRLSMTAHAAGMGDNGVYQVVLKQLREELAALDKACGELGLSMTQIAIQRAIREFAALPKAQASGFDDSPHAADKIVNTAMRVLIDETSLRFYLHLPESSHALFDNLRPFGEAVFRTFPKAAVDVEEAAKCLALARGTAAVFHSMRATEYGLRALIAESFGDPKFLDDMGTWGAITGRIRRESNHPDNKIAVRWRGKQDRLMKLALLVQQVADAFRNPTMHCEAAYTVDQATDVFNAAGSFMRRLAEDTEDGKATEEAADATGPRNPGPQEGGRISGPGQSGEG